MSMTKVWVELTREAIPMDRVREFIGHGTQTGAIVIFEGITRADEDSTHGSVVRLDYEAFESMAPRVLEELANQAIGRWRLNRVAVLHRLGSVEAGEASVVVATAAGHRAEAFESCRWLIDTLKQDVPIWKMDVFADGFVQWTDAE